MNGHLVFYLSPPYVKNHIGFGKGHSNEYTINTFMLKRTFLLILRNFKRFKGTFIINIVGLSTGLACAMLIYLWVNDELSIDNFFENQDGLFQVMQKTYGANGIETMEATPEILAKTLADEMSLLSRINRGLQGKTEKSESNYKPGSLAFAIWVLARLGQTVKGVTI